MKKVVIILIGLLLISLGFLSGCQEESNQESAEQSSTFLNIPPLPESPEIPEGTPNGWEMNYTEIFFNNFESSPDLGLDYSNYAELIDDAIDGEKSVKITSWHSLDTDPEMLPLSPDTYYMFEFDYKILDRGTNNENIISTFFYPEGSDSSEDVIHSLSLLSNAEEQGTFSSGALTTSVFDAYYLKIQASEGASIIIDNLKIFRLDPISITDSAERWSHVENIPYPRLGNYIGGTITSLARSDYTVPDWDDEYVYKSEDIEERLAFFDIVAGPHVSIQSKDTAFVKRLQEKNPNMIIMPYTNYIVTTHVFPSPHATINTDYEFYMQNFPDDWIMKYSNGSVVGAYLWPNQFNTNIYESCPKFDGQTYDEAITDYMINTVIGSGYWDGIFIDNVFAETSHYIPNYMNPSLFDYDVNLNSQQDETIAQVSELTRTAVLNFLQNLKNEVGENEMIIVNNGWNLDYTIASYVNGVTFELFTQPWSITESYSNELSWRKSLNDYFNAQEKTLEPHLNILEPGGGEGGYGGASENYLEPTAEDIKRHRFTLGTALLEDGFYEYDLYDMGGVPYWFEEYSVNNEGVAVEDIQYKGYLGMSLDEANELKSSATLVWEESFNSSSLPSSMEGGSGVSVENNKLVINNPDHTTYKSAGTTVNTKSGEISFESGKTYVIEFDWEILDTLDDCIKMIIKNNEENLASVRLYGVFEGDSNQEHFHITIPDSDEYQLKFNLCNGGGKVAIDNIKIYEGGAGPWRRDFENGFVLVNPINKEYTFSAEELTGDLDRTGIKRILGTQAPDINNGEPVNDSLTLQPFDAIILLADTI